MQIFSKNIHILTRGSAALASLYLIYSYKYNNDKIILLIGIIMLFFDVYTFLKTLHM